MVIIGILAIVITASIALGVLNTSENTENLIKAERMKNPAFDREMKEQSKYEWYAIVVLVAIVIAGLLLIQLR